MLLTGVIGVVIISIMSYVVPSLGVGSAMALIIVGQLIIGVTADHFGWFNIEIRQFDINRALGLLLILGGAWLILRK